MRVLFVTDVYEYYGATEALLQLISILSEQYDVEPVIGTSITGRIAEYAKINGFECYALGHPAFLLGESPTFIKKIARKILFPAPYFRYGIKIIIAMSRAKKYIDFKNIDIIHTNLNRNDIGGLLAKKYQIPHMWHIREFADLDYPVTPLRSNYIDYMNKQATVFPAISQAVAAHWIKKGISEEKIRLVYDGIDEGRFICREKNSDSHALKIAFCGSVNETKGQIQLIEALAGFAPEELRQIQADIYGSGAKEYLAFLNRKIREYGLENTVHMRGYCDCLETKLPDYDVGMMCSRSEGFGLVTVEYMMSGLCVIASDTGANPELVPDGECGLLYRYGDVEDLARKLRFALTHRETIAEMGAKARDHACRNFTAAANAERIYQIYRELLAAKETGAEE